MPLFEYQCRSCGHRFEALVVGSRMPACPRCNSDELEKQLSTFGLGSPGRSSGAGSYGGPSCAPGGG